MVVLEGSGGVVTIGNNQYLQPDYLAPLPSTMDAKKSPLALLAQTCSQIGADSTAVKPLLAMGKSKNSSTSSASSTNSSESSGSAKSPTQAKSPKSTTPTTSEVKLAFRPYENNVLSQQNTNSFKSSSSINDERPSSKSSSHGGDAIITTRVPSRSKSNTSPNEMAHNQYKTNGGELNGNGGSGGASTPTPTDSNNNRKTVSPSGSSQRGASPIVRSGMEVLNNANGSATHPKEMSSMATAAAAAAAAYKAQYGLNSLSALCCPPGIEHMNPAYRSSFPSGFTHHHAAMLAAAAAGAYPSGPNGPGAQPNSYITYQRIKTPSGVDAVVPVCKDPYCTSCPYSMHTAHTHQMLMGAPCPPGCTQCEQQKYAMVMMSGAGGLPPGHPYSQAAAAAAASAAAARSAPYVCSWVVGEAYCGKRFQTSDELFSHLRTHTGNLSDPAAAAAALAHSQQQAQSVLSSIFPQSALRAGYATPPLSPMSAAAARYHPYGKSGAVPPMPLGGVPSPFGAGAGAFNPAAAAAAAALGPYYAPYGMYSQRIGSAAVHQ